MSEYPNVPAAFINAIAEEGTKAEAVEWLQKQWNETCALRAAAANVVEAWTREDDSLTEAIVCLGQVINGRNL